MDYRCRSGSSAIMFVVTGLFGSTESIAAQERYSVTPADLQPIQKKEKTKHPSGSPKVTLVVKDSTIAYTVTTLARQARLGLLYDEENAVFSKRISVRISNANVMDVLGTVLRGTGVTAILSADGETIVIRPAENLPKAGMIPEKSGQSVATGEVTGVVMDSATARPLRGVTVSVTGTRVSRVSGENGRFTLRVAEGEQVVRFQSLGYTSVSRRVVVKSAQATSLNVSLVGAATALSGVVTTAIGGQRKLEVGSDIVRLNVDSLLANSAVNTVTDILENRVPGMTVVRTSGTPGDPARIRLRGAASIHGSNAPIVFVDGIRMYYPDGSTSNATSVSGTEGYYEWGEANLPANPKYPRPSPLDQIDPNSIETIEVMKGPSASAMYGSDAANGVILITTKKGRPGTTRWNMSAEQGISQLPGKYPSNQFVFGHILNGESMLNCHQLAIYPCIRDSLVTFQALNSPYLSPLTDGATSIVSAGVSGGSSALTYAFTGSWGKELGMLQLPPFVKGRYKQALQKSPDSWMEHPDRLSRWSATAQINAQLTSTMNLTVGFLLSNSDQQRSSLGLTGVSGLMGRYLDTASIVGLLYRDPLFSGFTERITAVTQTIGINGRWSWRVQPWLPFEVGLGINGHETLDKALLPAGLPRELTPDTSGGFGIARHSGQMTSLNATIPGIQLAARGSRQVTIGIGMNYVQDASGVLAATLRGIPVGVEEPTNLTALESQATQSSYTRSTFGWFAEPRVGFGERLFFNPGLRLDGGSASGSRAGLLSLPKMSLSYIAINNEGNSGGPFGWLSLLRLRMAGGVAGVQPEPEHRLRLFQSTTVTLDGGRTQTQAAVLTNLGNSRIHPERSREVEGGFDLDAWNQRMQLTVSYYNKTRIDAIERVQTSPSVGGDGIINIEGQWKNIGVIRNRGIEAFVSARLLDHSGIQWGVNVSVAHNANQIVSINSGVQSPRTNGIGRIIPGSPLFSVWSQMLVSYRDDNDDGILQGTEVAVSDSAMYIGSQDPAYTGAFSTDLGLFNNRVSLSSSIATVNGLTQYFSGGLPILNARANAEGATLLDQAQYLISREQAGQGGPYGILYYRYQRVSTVRWTNLSINVLMPQRIARMVRGSAVRLGIQGSNLMLWTNYRGKDPNVNAYSSGGIVADHGQLPMPRVWTLRVSVSQ